MPNNAYLRSTRREREIVNAARKAGEDSGRTAGSHSPWDVYVLRRPGEGSYPTPGRVTFIQVKTEKGGKKLVVKNEQTFVGRITLVEYHYVNEANRERKRESKRKGRGKAKGVKPRISGDVCGGN